MNVAYVLVATVWLAGQAPAADKAKPAPAPAPAPVAAACGCDACDDCGGGFFSKLRGWFHRDNCGCETACDSCGGGHKWFSGWHREESCDSCNDCGRVSLRDRFRGWFHRDDCCDSCCGAAAAPAAAPQKLHAPQSEPPKKLPGAGTGDAKEARRTPPQPLVAPAGSLILEQ